MKRYTIEVFHKDDPLYLVDILADDVEGACKTAKNAIWMKALKDGREFHLDDISSNEYIEENYTS